VPTPTPALHLKIDIRKLKHFASIKLPHNSPLREVLLSEKDHMTVDEFLHKLDVWLKLCHLLPEEAEK